jgi:hypothetical protein
MTPVLNKLVTLSERKDAEICFKLNPIQQHLNIQYYKDPATRFISSGF